MAAYAPRTNVGAYRRGCGRVAAWKPPMMARKKPKPDPIFLCLDCSVDTAELQEYYMLRREVWRGINPPTLAAPRSEGMLCIGCVEARLGRKLTYEDFLWAPINLHAVFNGSERLRDRMGADGMIAHGLADISLGDLASTITDAIASEHKNLGGQNKP
jgi:hypothetical protein